MSRGVGNSILVLLSKKPRQTPISMAKELNLSVSTVRNTLVILSGMNFVINPVRGLYEISSLGQSLVSQEKRHHIGPTTVGKK